MVRDDGFLPSQEWQSRRTSLPRRRESSTLIGTPVITYSLTTTTVEWRVPTVRPERVEGLLTGASTRSARTEFLHSTVLWKGLGRGFVQLLFWKTIMIQFPRPPSKGGLILLTEGKTTPRVISHTSPPDVKTYHHSPFTIHHSSFIYDLFPVMKLISWLSVFDW